MKKKSENLCFLFVKVKVKWLSHVQLCDPMDCSPPGFSIHGILQARILEWVAISFSRGSPQPRDRTHVSLIAGRRFNLWATREALLIYDKPLKRRWTESEGGTALHSTNKYQHLWLRYLNGFKKCICKAKEFEKNICFTDYAKAFECVDHNKQGNF